MEEVEEDKLQSSKTRRDAIWGPEHVHTRPSDGRRKSM